MNRCNAWLIGLSLVGLILQATVVPAQQELPIIDAHSQFDRTIQDEQILSVVKEAGVSRVLLSGRGGENIEKRALALAQAWPDLISALVGSKWDYLKEAQFVVSFVERAKNPAFAGMAELLVTHGSDNNPKHLFPGMQISLDASQIQAGIRVARQHGWPLILHLEFVDMGENAAQRKLPELEELLRENRDLRVGLIHMGQLNEQKAAALLAAHENLFLLTSQADNITAKHTRGAIERGNTGQTGWINMFAGRSLHREWKELMIRYPDRFVLAFDNVFKESWSERYARKVTAWRQALSELPPEVAHKIAHGNAERLWKLPPAKNRVSQ